MLAALLVIVLIAVGAAMWLGLRRGRSARLDGAGTDPAANVLLVTLDTTRADRLGAYGYTAVETPQLDALAADGVRFERAIASVPLTLPAHSSLMTGSTPMHHRVRDNGGFFLDPEQTTLAEVLLERGFSTAAFIGAFVLNRHWGLDQGFLTYDDEFGPDDPRQAVNLHEQRVGAEVVDQALDWWDAHPGERFFVWLHLYDPHYPYEPPGEFGVRYRDAPYDGEIAYTDAQLGRVFDYLKRHGLWDSTLVVVLGDHGEGLGEHGEPDHGIYLYDSTLRVPLIMRTPGAAYRGVVEAVVRDMDVMPTVLDYLEIATPGSVRGSSLLPLMAGRREDEQRWAYSECAYVRYHYGWKDLVAVRGERYKYIDVPRPELYDLRNDPGEMENLADEMPGRVESMRGILAELRREAGASGEVQMPEAMDPEALARLQSLGYLGTAAPVAGEDLADPKDKSDVLDLLIRASRLAGSAMRSGRYAEAAAVVEEALRREPNFMDGYQFLGTLYLRLGRPDEAIAALRRILDVNPESTQARMSLARCYMAKQDYAAALGLADAVIATAPTDVAAYYAAADALSAQERYDDAAARLRRLIEVRPDARHALYEIGRLYLVQGRIEEARRQIRDALEAEPRIRSAHFNLALIAEQRGEKQLAVEEYGKEIELFPNNVEALTNLGILHMQRGEVGAGVAAFERLLAVSPEDASSNYLLARALLESGRDLARALELARKAERLEPGNPRILALVGELERRGGATASFPTLGPGAARPQPRDRREPGAETP